MASFNCLQTQVRNTCGKTRFFGYLPQGGQPRGKKLQDNEEYEFDGDLFEIVAHDPRLVASLHNDLSNGRLVVTRTPAPHFYDDARDTASIVRVNDGHVLVDDPCWGHYKSSEVSPTP